MEAQLTMNLAKCEFARATVTYLGKVVGQGIVHPVNAKIEAINKYSPPCTKRELMHFLGWIGYYRNFCRNFSEIVAPLTDLLKVSCLFGVQPAKMLLKMLKRCSLVLQSKWDRPFKMHVDASEIGAGAVILQDAEEGVEHPVCLFDRKFLFYQLNY